MLEPLTGAAAGLLSCEVCEQLAQFDRTLPPDAALRCARCGAALHRRKPDSLTRTTALLTAATILYIPANLLPVMHTDSLLGAEDDTILSGVMVLVNTGSWPLAVLVFVASIVVPMLKLLTLAFLVYGAWRRSSHAQRQRTRLYRLVEAIGRWSMLDIYVITLLVSLVQFRSLATIQPGTGALAFASVVVLTMFAAQSFDPRLIWEAANERPD
jgi:paraquat-inducible protein A